jgi:pyridoxamine 5'-phosphate oxidase
MQPAYYENFDEIIKKIWSMLGDAIKNRSSQFRIPTFICGNQNDFDGRIVVLRRSNIDERLLQFHSDIRSEKISKLKSNNKAALLFYDKEEKIQVRAKVECTINHKNKITEESWSKTAHISRKCYLVENGPGTETENPTSGLKPELDNFDYTMEESEKGYENFTVIQCKVISFEWLYLAAKGHRRARFEYGDNLGSGTTFVKKTWLVP